jgi:hypothetical protein
MEEALLPHLEKDRDDMARLSILRNAREKSAASLNTHLS